MRCGIHFIRVLQFPLSRERKFLNTRFKKWAESVEKRKEDPNFNPANNEWKHKFPQIDITGNAAVVKVELFKDGNKVFTDYLSLYKFENGEWKIVSKIYYRHER